MSVLCFKTDCDLIKVMVNRNVDLFKLTVVIFDGSTVNTVSIGDVIKFDGVAIVQPLQWRFCLLHANELL